MTAAVLFGTAASGGTAATAGLVGSAGAFSATTAIGTLGTVAAVGGALTSAAAARQGLEAQASAASFNADLARQEASAEEARRRRASQRRLSSIRTGIAKSGVTTEGTPLLVLAESAEQAEIDALSARFGGANNARLFEQRAKSARKAVPFAVGSSLLTGATNIGRSLS